MKKFYLLMLCAYSSVYAESRVLPPVVDNSIYSGGSVYSNSKSTTNAMFELLGRLEQMQLEMQQLRGLVEEQSQSIAALKKRQRNIYSDLDQRMQDLSGGGILVKPVDEVHNNQLVDNQVVNSDSAVKSVAVNQSDSIPVENQPTIAIVQEVPVKNQKQLYDRAYETLRNGHNTRAISAFSALITEFPHGEFADNSQYWLAEAYKANQDVNSAKKAFSKVVSDYSTSPKVPDALLKLAYIEIEQNNFTKARDYLTQVTGNYPGTTAAHLATKKLIQMGVMQP